MNGVVPLAATAISTSSGAIPWLCTRAAACAVRILGALDRARHRLLAARDQQQQALRRPAEGRHQLRAILYRKPPRCPGTGIGKPPAGAQPRLHGKRRLQQRRPRGPHRGNGGELALDHRIQDVRGLPEVDIGITRARPFCVHETQNEALRPGFSCPQP